MSIPSPSAQTRSLHVALEPVSNALNSFSLLNKVEQLSGLNTWVIHTFAALTSEQRRMNRLVFEGLRDALMPQPDEPNFPSYLHNFSEVNPYNVRKMVIESLRQRFSRHVSYAPPTMTQLLNNRQTYLDCVKSVQGELLFDLEIQMQVHRLLQEPTTLQQTILAHLERMWQTTFIAEWRRVQRSLSWQVDMFTRSLHEEMTVQETFRTLTGRELPASIARIAAEASRITLIPSWHTGRHVTIWEDVEWEGDVVDLGKKVGVRLFFSEPPNYDIEGLRATPVGKGELRARLDALADETRLRIIELLVQRDELAAQDIIAELDLSQSSVSRHLKQLVSMRYLYERRGEGANKTYRLSSFYFGRTARAIEQLVVGTEPQTASSTELHETLPQELRRFLDSNGKLTMWPPSRPRDKVLILEYLASFFEPGRRYSEKEVNELLQLHSTFKDAAALRRGLCEYQFMDRKQDGSAYWLIEQEGETAQDL